VAIVDDDPRMLESVEELLESAGYSTRSFCAAEALLADGLAGFDVIISDIGMPGMDGFALRDLVMRQRPNLPVFLVTGRHEIADQHRAKGVSGFFRKPFDATVLLASIGDALRDREEGGG